MGAKHSYNIIWLAGTAQADQRYKQLYSEQKPWIYLFMI